MVRRPATKDRKPAAHYEFAVAIRKDYAGIERMVFAAKEGGKYADLLLEIAK